MVSNRGTRRAYGITPGISIRIASKEIDMRVLVLILLLLLIGCPKTNVPDPQEKERQEALRELISDEDVFDDIPEDTDDEEDEDPR